LKIVIPDDYQNAVRSLECYASVAGHEVVIYNDTVKDVDALAERFRGAEALVLIRERTTITDPLLVRLPTLRLISQTGRGVPHIDLAACTRHGIAVAVGGGAPYATVELTWGLILAGMRRIPREMAYMKAHGWQSGGAIGLGLRGRTLGIYGYGKIGGEVAKIGRAFGMNILVWGREESQSRAGTDGFPMAASKRELFQQLDVLSLHLKLNDATRGIVTADDLAEMKPSALIVNTSRAELVASGALISALRQGRPGFAAVDVYENEPMRAGHPLLHMENVICTPHLGYVEKDSYELYFREAFDNLLAFVEGKPANLLNPEAVR